MSAEKAELGAVGAQPLDIAEIPNTTHITAGHKPAFWCAFIVVASAILMPASTGYAGDDLGDYAIAVSAVSLGLGLLMMIWYKVISDDDDSEVCKKRLDLPLLGPLNIEMMIAAFFAVWWIVGANILTFNGPHLVPGNGYFSAWGGAFAGIGYLANVSGRSMSAIGSSILRGSGALYALTVPSIVLIIAVTKQFCALFWCSSYLDTDRFYPEAALGLSVGIISLGFILLVALGSGYQSHLSDDAKQAVRWGHKLASLVLLGMWTAAFIILTFHEPFTATGNGYHSLVLGLVFSVAFALQQFPELEKAIEKTAV